MKCKLLLLPIIALLFLAPAAAFTPPDCNMDASYTQTGNVNCNSLTTNGYTWQTDGYNLNVSGDVLIDNGGLVNASAGGNNTFNSLDIDSGGEHIASPELTTIKGENAGGYALDIDGDFNSSEGTINITTTSQLILDLAGTSGNVYNLNLVGGGTMQLLTHSVIDNDLYVNLPSNRYFFIHPDSITLNVTGDVTLIEGHFGDDSEDADWRFGSLTVEGGQFHATTGTVTITNEAASGRSVNVFAGSTFTHNSGTFIHATPQSANINMAGTGEFYNLNISGAGNILMLGYIIVENDFWATSGNTLTNAVSRPLTVNATATIEDGALLSCVGANPPMYFEDLVIKGTYEDCSGETYVNDQLSLYGTFKGGGGSLVVKNRVEHYNNDAKFYSETGSVNIGENYTSSSYAYDFGTYSLSWFYGDNATVTIGTIYSNGRFNMSSTTTTFSSRRGAFITFADVGGADYHNNGTVIFTFPGTSDIYGGVAWYNVIVDQGTTLRPSYLSSADYSILNDLTIDGTFGMEQDNGFCRNAVIVGDMILNSTGSITQDTCRITTGTLARFNADHTMTANITVLGDLEIETGATFTTVGNQSLVLDDLATIRVFGNGTLNLWNVSFITDDLGTTNYPQINATDLSVDCRYAYVSNINSTGTTIFCTHWSRNGTAVGNWDFVQPWIVVQSPSIANNTAVELTIDFNMTAYDDNNLYLLSRNVTLNGAQIQWDEINVFGNTSYEWLNTTDTSAWVPGEYLVEYSASDTHNKPGLAAKRNVDKLSLWVGNEKLDKRSKLGIDKKTTDNFRLAYSDGDFTMRILNSEAKTSAIYSDYKFKLTFDVKTDKNGLVKIYVEGFDGYYPDSSWLGHFTYGRKYFFDFEDIVASGTKLSMKRGEPVCKDVWVPRHCTPAYCEPVNCEGDPFCDPEDEICYPESCVDAHYKEVCTPSTNGTITLSNPKWKANSWVEIDPTSGGVNIVTEWVMFNVSLIPPVITNPRTNQTNYFNGDTANITATVTDGNLDTVLCEYRSVNYTATNVEGDDYSCNITGLTKNEIITWYFHANDTKGTWAHTAAQTLNVYGILDLIKEIGRLTEFKTGDIALPTVMVMDASGDALTNFDCNISIYDPDMATIVDGVDMPYLTGATGLYQYNFTVPSTKGVYTWQAFCSGGGNSKFMSSQFQNTSKGGEGMIGIALALIAGLFIFLGTLIDKEISKLIYVLGILLMTASVFSLIFEVEGVAATQTTLLYGVGSGMLWILVIAIAALVIYFFLNLVEGILEKT